MVIETGRPLFPFSGKIEMDMYIDTEEALSVLCEKIKGYDMLALDTEFVREKTYYHRLGLIQVATDGICAAIDPIAVPRLQPFLDVIKDPNVIKVFHASKQDLEILNRLCGETLRPIFDTQIAASLVGWGSQISFAKIVQKVSRKRICKSERYTDWCHRPLSKGQIEYAMDDVRYLVPVYEKLNQLIRKLDREEWLKGEFHVLEDPETYKLPEPKEQYLKLKNIRNLQTRHLAVLIHLTAWREREAQQRDVLPKSIIRDETLTEVARLVPQDLGALGAVRGFFKKELSRSGKEILSVIRAGLEVPEHEVPDLPEADGYATRRGVEELLSACVKIRAEELKVEANILADRRQIHDFVRCYEETGNVEHHFLFQSWRKDCIGTMLYSIMDGKMALAIGKDERVTLIPLHQLR